MSALKQHCHCQKCNRIHFPEVGCFDVNFIYPPIPDRRFDYQATLHNYDEGDAVGFGKTEALAIEDLRTQIEENL